MALPNFYAGPDAGTALSQGLMAGYEFVDRIRARRQEELDRRRQLELQNAQEVRANAAEARAQEAFDVSKQDHTRALQRQNDMDLAHITGATILSAGGMDKLTPEDRASLIKAGRSANSSWAKLSDDEVWQNVENNAMLHDDRVTEQNVRDLALKQRETGYEELLTGMNARSAQIQGRAPAQAPASPSNGATAPQGLAQRGVEVARTQVPENVRTTYPRSNPVLGGMFGHKEAPAPIARKLPTEVEVPNENSDGPVLARPINEKELSDSVAKAPLEYASDWAKKRGQVTDHTRRNMTDARVFSAVQEDLDAAKAEYDAATDPKTKATLGRRMVTRDAQLQALAKARGDSAVDAVASRGAPIGDRAVTAVNGAAQAYAQGNLPITPEQLRGLETTVSRAAEGKTTRVTPLQIKRIAHAMAIGLITPEQGENYMKYGSMEKPEKPTVQPLGDGYAAIVTQGGVKLMQLPTAGGNSGGGAEGAAQNRLLTNDRLTQAFEFMKETYGKKEAQAHMNSFLQIVKREGGQLMNKSGIPLIDPRTGAFNPGLTDPGELAELLDTYKRYDSGEVDAFFKSGRSYTDYAPQGVGGGGGWTVTPVQ